MRTVSILALLLCRPREGLKRICKVLHFFLVCTTCGLARRSIESWPLIDSQPFDPEGLNRGCSSSESATQILKGENVSLKFSRAVFFPE